MRYMKNSTKNSAQIILQRTDLGKRWGAIYLPLPHPMGGIAMQRHRALFYFLEAPSSIRIGA